MRNVCLGSFLLLLLVGSAAACSASATAENPSDPETPSPAGEQLEGGAKSDATTSDDGATATEKGEWKAMPQTVAKSDALSIWGASSSDLWIGLAGGTFGMLEAMRWDGSKFTEKPLLSATGVGVTIAVRGITGTSANDVWLAGGSSRGTEGGKLYHFDGTTFDVTTDNPAGNGYTAAFALAKNDVWAADRNYGQTKVGSPLHFDGARWTRPVDTGAFGPTEVLTLWGASSNDVWAGSLEGFAHWNGTAWSKKDTDTDGNLINASVHAILGFSASDVWAATNESKGFTNLGAAMRHFDGKSWSAPAFIGDKKLMRALWGSSSSDIWAVGTGTMHYDGKAWTDVASPLPAGTLLNAAYGFGPLDVWAVGAKGVVLHYEKATR